VKKDNYAVIPPDGQVKNQIPGFEGCEITILSSPKLGAHFVDYLVSLLPGGSNLIGFGGDGVESFAYVLSGEVWASDGEAEQTLAAGGYIFVPADRLLYLENRSGARSELFLYKRRFQPLPETSRQGAVASVVSAASSVPAPASVPSSDSGATATPAPAERSLPPTVIGNVASLPAVDYEDMTDVHFTTLLPADDLAFDMNMHILAFDPGASHGYVETHVQEHGALILSGEGLYLLDNDWIPVQEGDYIFMASYCLQAGYAVGRGSSFAYLYSKDCNRDEPI
jgi:(S)-ureidoglycine aminohydrolase